MCLGIPGQLKSINLSEPVCPMGQVHFGHLSKEICLAYTPEAKPGDYLLVHAGFAISIMNESEAKKVLQALDSLELNDELSD